MHSEEGRSGNACAIARAHHTQCGAQRRSTAALPVDFLSSSDAVSLRHRSFAAGRAWSRSAYIHTIFRHITGYTLFHHVSALPTVQYLRCCVLRSIHYHAEGTFRLLIPFIRSSRELTMTPFETDTHSTVGCMRPHDYHQSCDFMCFLRSPSGLQRHLRRKCNACACEG